MNLFKTLLLSIVVQIVGCSSGPCIEDGFWYGKYKTGAFDYPVLFQIKGHKVIDYYDGKNDTLSLEKDGDKFFIKGNEKYKESYLKLTENSLGFYSNKYHEPLFRLAKANSKSFVFDVLENKDVVIELAQGIGHREVFGVNHKFYNAFYFSNIKNELNVSFCDTIFSFNKKLFFEELITNEQLCFIKAKHILPVSLVVDKNVSIKDYNELIKCFRAAGYSDISILIQDANYEYANCISMALPALSDAEESLFWALEDSIFANKQRYEDEMSEETMFLNPESNANLVPPPPPPAPDREYLREQVFFIVGIDNGVFNLNSKDISDAKLRGELKNRLLSKPSIISHT